MSLDEIPLREVDLKIIVYLFQKMFGNFRMYFISCLDERPSSGSFGSSRNSVVPPENQRRRYGGHENGDIVLYLRLFTPTNGKIDTQKYS